MKALPLTYNSDMQEDKESLFDTIDTQRSCLRILTRLLQTTEFRTDRMEAATQGDYSTATDLADALAAKGLPFREAYQLVGGLVKESLRSGKSLETLETLTPVELRSLSPLLDREALASLKPRSSVEARITYGGTAPGRVEHQLKEAKDCLRQTWQRIPGSQGSSAESPL